MLYKKKRFVWRWSQYVDKEVVTFTLMFLKADFGTKASCEEEDPGTG